MTALDEAEIRREVDSVPLWYHTIDLGHGVVTQAGSTSGPSWRRCRGPTSAGSGVSTSAPTTGSSPSSSSGAAPARSSPRTSPPRTGTGPCGRRLGGLAYVEGWPGRKAGPSRSPPPPSSQGAAGVRERLRPRSFRARQFDVVVCGSLLLHLRDPFRALEGIRSVCDGEFLSAEEIDARLTLLSPRRTAFHLNGKDCQWLIPNVAAHRRMLHPRRVRPRRAVRPLCDPVRGVHPGGHPTAADLTHRRRPSPPDTRASPLDAALAPHPPPEGPRAGKSLRVEVVTFIVSFSVLR